MLKRKVICNVCGESYPDGWPHECSKSALAAGSTPTRDEVLEIGKELARQVTIAIATGAELDRTVLRHWANRYHEAHRKLA